jgi:crossover junction endodeoxyribonuclease RuvC
MGIDPGTHRMGFAVVEERGNSLVAVEYGTHRAVSSRPLPERLAALHGMIRESMRRHALEAVAIEDVFFGKSLVAAIRIGEGRAVAILAAAELGLPVIEYAPALVKKSVAANGAASKDQVAAMAKTILGLKHVEVEIEPDASDALAIAITHLHRARWDRGSPAASAAPRPRTRPRRARPAPRGAGTGAGTFPA